MAARILRGEREAASCPACGARALDPFYLAEDLPVHSVLLMDSREQARCYPRGALRLAFCRACGFVTNTLYDPALQDYSPRCEESQACSPTFNEFSRQLAGRLLRLPGVKGGRVVELGCGKGDFLAQLVEGGAAGGVGIDPGADAERLPAELRGRIEIVRQKYRPEHARFQADLLCCRHALEHIGEVGAFLDLVRAALGEGRRVPVFFEVPDLLRVLGEGAFWDLYYEHCSYFSAGSLARLFRARRFSIAELGLEFGGQYILLTAYPEAAPTAPPHALEDDLDRIAAAVDAFRRGLPASLGRWRAFLDGAAARRERVAVWGSSSKGVAFLTTLGAGAEVDVVVDINPLRQGRFMPGSGHEIVAPERLVERPPRHVVLMNPIYRAEVGALLERLGIRAELHTV